MTTYLEHPWVKHVARSKYMVELLRFLRVGRKVTTITAKFKEIPEDYLFGALEALESLGVVKSLTVSGERFYVLTSDGKLLLSYIESLTESSV